MIERLEGSGDSCRYRHSPQTRQYTGQAARTTRLLAPAGRAGSSHNRSDWRYCRLRPSACRLVRPKAAVHRHAASGSASFLGALSFATAGRFSARRQTRARPHVRDFIRGAAAVISVASARATTGSPSAAMAVTLKCVPSVTRIVPPAGLSARDRQILRRFRWISPAPKPDGLSASQPVRSSGLDQKTDQTGRCLFNICLFTKDANGGGGVIPHCLSADSGAGVGGSQPMARRRLLYRVWQHRPWFWEVLQGGLLCRHRSPVVVSGCWRFDALARFRSHSRPVANTEAPSA